MSATQIVEIPLQQIRPSRHQTRKHFEDPHLLPLVESLRMEGLIEPILVHRTEDNEEVPYELISGERRLRAAQRLGWDSILARCISVVSEGEAAAKGVITNVQRQSLDPIDEAEAFAELNHTDPNYWSFDRIAQACGKSLVYIQQSLKLLQLPKPVQDHICQGLLTRSQALEIVRLPHEDLQLQAASQLADRRTAKTARLLAEAMIRKMQPAATPPPVIASVTVCPEYLSK